MPRGKETVERYVRDIEWIRGKLLPMDALIKPVMGIRDWDDAVVIKFNGKKLVASVDGPYKKRLVLKSALVHASTDVVVKGARPLFALDALTGLKPDLEEMLDSLKIQAEALGIPILGGNTFVEDVEPSCSIAVVGELLADEPIRDSTAEAGDVVCLLGQPIWGDCQERIQKAMTLFNTWYAIIKKAKINSAKDVTKGGVVSVVYEMEKKSNKKFRLAGIPYPMTRNLDNFILTLPDSEYTKLNKACIKHDCRLCRIGVVE